MGIWHTILTGTLLAASAASQAGVHPPELEGQLAFLVNDWTIEGHESKYRETCTWYEARSFVVCDTLDKTESTPARSVSILGWSAATKNYTYHHYAQDGRSRSETCFANDLKGLTCLGERRTDTGIVQSRSYIWPVAGGAAFRNERSTNGGPWSETVRLKYVPRKQ